MKKRTRLIESGGLYYIIVNGVPQFGTSSHAEALIELAKYKLGKKPERATGGSWLHAKRRVRS